jgi:putative heme-binding domain-containing protein
MLAAAIGALTQWRDRAETAAAIRPELDRAVAEIHGTTGVLICWHVSQPLSQDAAATIVAKRPTNAAERRAAGWQTQLAAGTEGRLALSPPDAEDNSVWLAHTSVRVPEPTDVEFLASSSGTLQVSLNGRPIHERLEPRRFQVDSDRFSATLAAGENQLLVMTGRTSGRPEFHLRFRRKSSTAAHERLIQAALGRAGNADRGRSVFLDAEKSQCIKCHRIGDQGERTGPELTGVSSRFSRIYLVESMLQPSRTIAPSFGTLTVRLVSGQTVSGVKTAGTDAELTLVDNQGQKHLVPKTHIDEQKPSPISTMPEGLEKRLTEQEFVDLVGFLMSLKEARGPQ